MPRSLVIGNGEMLVNVDKKGTLRDFYFPYVGLEEHTTGHIHRIGIFEEGTGSFTWLHEDDWQADIDYLPETLIGVSTLTSQKWGLTVTFQDFVTVQDNIFCRRLVIKNHLGNERKLRVFFNFDFHIYGNKSNDTVFYAPGHQALVYYNRKRYFLVTASKRNGIIDQFSTGKTEYKGLEGTWRDAEDGQLSLHPISQGSVDGTFGLHITVAPNATEPVDAWVTAGKTADEVYDLNLKVKTVGLEKLTRDTKNYWSRWVNKLDTDFDHLPEEYLKLYKQSLLIIRTQVDNRGAIIAANDTDIRQFNKDDYSYVWPRDGALIATALDQAGYAEVTRPFFKFCAKVQTRQGFLLHKYTADGSVGSSWHPMIFQDCPQSPLQEDETALPLVALWNHYCHSPDIEFLHDIYDTFVLRAADFLVKYRDPQTNLPLPSYDLWEEQHGVFTFTTAAVYAGLRDAAKICDALGSFTHRDKYQKAAKEVKEAALKYLYSEKHQRFLKKINFEDSKIVEEDATIDASVAAVFLFDLLEATDPRVVSTMEQFATALKVPTEIGGFARYQGDQYQRSKKCPPEITGNPWIITTLWYAQWCLLAAKSADDPKYKEALNAINWTCKHATKSQILPEQIDPQTGAHLSVAPLTWSHATYVKTIRLLHKRNEDFGISS